MAKTLLTGRLKNPAPDFYQLFKYPLMIVDQHQWMSQYTIGHPLFLAFGYLSGLLDFIVPFVSAGTLLLIYLITKDQFGSRVAAVALSSCSALPTIHSHWRYLLGYPAATFSAALMIFSAFRFYSSPKWQWAFWFCLGSLLLILNRPQSWLSLGMPLGMFLVAISIKQRDRSSWGAIGVLLAITLASIGVFFLVNYGQTGDPFKTSQYVFLEHHTGLLRFKPQSGLVNFALSIIRQNIWLFGWPFSFVFLFFVAREPGLWHFC